MIRRAALPVLLAFALAPFTGCSEDPPPPPPRKKVEPKMEAPKEKPPEKPAETPDASVPKKVNPDLDPSNPVFKQQAPAEFRVRFTTTKGEFDVKVTREWAPHGADHFYALVKTGFYNDTRFFRVVPGFMVQFGINGDPRVSAKLSEASIPDDPVKQSNTRGMVTFAKKNTPNSRSTQIFVSFKDKNAFLDSQGFAPFGTVTEGMEIVDSINADYREAPQQPTIQSSGNAYLDAEFPNLDKIKSAKILE
jgi:peptidyl-prolyl cis-trans isomerase A (cyclophilin A)